MYGETDYSDDKENCHDKQVVPGYMDVLKKIFNEAISDCHLTHSQIHDFNIPDWPLDYFASQWRSGNYSCGSFSYIPLGVNGLKEMKAMSSSCEPHQEKRNNKFTY